MEIVARIRNDYDEKFGVPRQAGLAAHAESRIVMEPGFRIKEAFRGIEAYRPNGIGISAVKLENVDLDDPDGAFLTVSGADLKNGTPIYDIKPYVALSDAHPEASDVLGGRRVRKKLKVICSGKLLSVLSETERPALIETLELDPRPAYQNDPERIYGMRFGDWNIRFRIQDKLLTVLSIDPI